MPEFKLLYDQVIKFLSIGTYTIYCLGGIENTTHISKMIPD